MTTTISAGTITPYGVFGDGYDRSSDKLRERLAAAADALGDLTSTNVEIRVNSNGLCGGAWVITTPSGGTTPNTEIGIVVDDNIERYVAHIKTVALSEQSPLRPDLSGYTFVPPIATNDALHGLGARVQHTGTLPDALAFIGEHIRPVVDIVDTLTEHRAIIAKFTAENTWWAVVAERDGRTFLALARRRPAAESWTSEPTREALAAYARTNCLLAGAAVVSATSRDLARRFYFAEGALAAEPGRVYEVADGTMTATRYNSVKVANLSASMLGSRRSA